MADLAFLIYSSLCVLAITLLYQVIAGAIYRLYNSPISHIPGPKMAALTFWYIHTIPTLFFFFFSFREHYIYIGLYFILLTNLITMSLSCFRYEFYYDIVLRGQYIFHLRTLHARYGPIIRINPYEVHISDPLYYDTIYVSSASGEKRDKWEWSAKAMAIPGSIISTIGHEHHKARRVVLNRFFSMASVRKLHPVVEERVRLLMERIRGFKNADEKVLNVNWLFGAFANGRSLISCYLR